MFSNATLFVFRANLSLSPIDERVTVLQLSTMEATFSSDRQRQRYGRSHSSSIPEVVAKSSTPSCNSGVDSGYASQNGTPTSDPAITLDLTKAFGVKKRQLCTFNDISIPETTFHRFEDLQREFAKPLYNFLHTHYSNLGYVSMKLIVLGETHGNAKPCVLVQCEDKIAAKVKQFFKKKQVKSQYQPRDPQSGFPDLEVFVCPRPPQPMAMFLEQDVWGEVDPLSGVLGHSAGHGSRIKASADDGSYRIATLGGFVRVSVNQDEGIYGFTVGHIFQNGLDNMAKNQNMGMIDNSYHERMIDEYEDDDDNDDYEDDDDSVILDFDFSNEDKTTARQMNEDELPEQGFYSMEESGAAWTTVGRTLCISSGGFEPGDDKDWALLELAQGWPIRQSSSPGSGLLSMNDPSLKYNPNSLGAARGRPVILLTSPVTRRDKEGLVDQLGSSRTGTTLPYGRKGYLRNDSSFLMLSSGNRFTTTYNLQFSDGGGKSSRPENTYMELMPSRSLPWRVWGLGNRR